MAQAEALAYVSAFLDDHATDRVVSGRRRQRALFGARNGGPRALPSATRPVGTGRMGGHVAEISIDVPLTAERWGGASIRGLRLPIVALDTPTPGLFDHVTGARLGPSSELCDSCAHRHTSFGGSSRLAPRT